MSQIRTHVKRGDRVEVISGAFRGAQGTVTQVQSAKGRVLIEGVRMIKKAARPTQDRPNGGIIEKEGPIHISNVKRVEEEEKPKGKATKKKVAKKK